MDGRGKRRFALSARRQGTNEYISLMGASCVAPRYSVKGFLAYSASVRSDSTVQTRNASSVSIGSAGENGRESFTTKTVSMTNFGPRVERRPMVEPNKMIEPGASLRKAGWLSCLQLLYRKESPNTQGSVF